MKVLIAIPHYPFFLEDDEEAINAAEIKRRNHALHQTILWLNASFSARQFNHRFDRQTMYTANTATAGDVSVVVSADAAVFDPEPFEDIMPLFDLRLTNAESNMLGNECHRALGERLGEYDFYGYLSDDLLIYDPYFFLKLFWFNQEFGDDYLLLPSRFETSGDEFLNKLYIDGDAEDSLDLKLKMGLRHSELSLEAEFLGLKFSFYPPTNPHAGCFFLNSAQAKRWVFSPHYLSRGDEDLPTKESAAVLSVGREFQIVKPIPTNAAFLEVHHIEPEYVANAPD